MIADHHRSYTDCKYFSIAIHHKVIMRISITGKLVKVQDILLAGLTVIAYPAIKPLPAFINHLFII